MNCSLFSPCAVCIAIGQCSRMNDRWDVLSRIFSAWFHLKWQRCLLPATETFPLWWRRWRDIYCQQVPWLHWPSVAQCFLMMTVFFLLTIWLWSVLFAVILHAVFEQKLKWWLLKPRLLFLQRLPTQQLLMSFFLNSILHIHDVMCSITFVTHSCFGVK